jgi:protease II
MLPDQGVVFAMAHIRGGSDMGCQSYPDSNPLFPLFRLHRSANDLF